MAVGEDDRWSGGKSGGVSEAEKSLGRGVEGGDAVPVQSGVLCVGKEVRNNGITILK